MKSIFSLRLEYWEYYNDCLKDGEKPAGFRDWFETAYHYDMADEMPTGKYFDGTFSSFSLAHPN